MNLYRRGTTDCRTLPSINHEEYVADTSLESTNINLALSKNIFNTIYAFGRPI